LKKALVISAIASNQGKTLLTMALLQHYKKSVRPFKCGPDFIDPQFHEKIAQTPSVNLDAFMMNEKQVEWMYGHYFDKDVAIVEGVMGYYDGMDKGSSAYDIAKIINAPSLLILDAGGSYITISAILKGMCEFREDNTIKAVVLNKVSSKMHYELVKKHIEKEVPHIKVCGWIQKGLKTLSSTHLGLDLKELNGSEIESVSEDVLEHIELDTLESVMDVSVKSLDSYPFKKQEKKDELCVLVKDENFSFVYHDNLEYLREIYREVKIIKSTKDEEIPQNADIVIIPGGYVETEESYKRVQDSLSFKTSLQLHAKSKTVYAECAGLIYLGESCDTKEMSGILPIRFELTNKRERLGYYKCEIEEGKELKGHAFHYSRIVKAPHTDIKLYKVSKKSAKEGAYKQGEVFATYLHTLWREAEPF
jgi:cobyrinic acid a,c-diamide synthase